MESIIHILIHSKIFLELFLKIKNNNRKSLTYLFNNFIKNSNSSFNKIEIFNFSIEYYIILWSYSDQRFMIYQKWGNSLHSFFLAILSFYFEYFNYGWETLT